MIDWLETVPRDRVFVEGEDRIQTYGEVLDRALRRPVSGVELLRPVLEVGSLIDVLAVMSRGSAVLLAPGSPVPQRIDPAGAATVVYTSGSSGVPKGVRLTTGNWEAAARASAQHLGHGEEDVWLLAMPPHHVGGLAILLRTAYAGGRVRLMARFDPVSYAEELRRGVTIASVVPTMLRRVLDVDPGPYPEMRAVLVGGGPIPNGLLERAVDAGLPVLPTYGMTETCGQVATLMPGHPVERKAHPLPGAELRIGVDGRILLRGPMVSPGYLGEADRDPAAWFVTGDLGEIDGDGAVRVLGRADTIIVTGGENVAPEQVEAVLSEVPGVEAAVVVGVASEEWGMEVACLYTGTIEAEVLAGTLRARLPGRMVPKRWMKVDRLPETGPGKADRIAAVDLLNGS